MPTCLPVSFGPTSGDLDSTSHSPRGDRRRRRRRYYNISVRATMLAVLERLLNLRGCGDAAVATFELCFSRLLNKYVFFLPVVPA